ncbi:hypothetical protein [Scytonema sp. PCC 10023]|uniref:hypothetical protein n=1 Tax=Scytonema sp. PCC 10023 TaxID=1680591 RepID=UPI0039C69B51
MIFRLLRSLYSIISLWYHKISISQRLMGWQWKFGGAIAQRASPQQAPTTCRVGSAKSNRKIWT